MIDKIDLIAYEKLAVSFGYYVINIKDRDAYFLYKNKEDNYLILYLDELGIMFFIETSTMKRMNRKELFIFLSDDMRLENIRNKIIETNSIEEYTKANFTKKNSKESIISGFLNLKKIKHFNKESFFSEICFDKNGMNVSLLYHEGNPKGFPSELINYDEDTENVKSFLGNYGFYSNLKNDSNTTYITYHPFLLKDLNLDKFCYVICKYNATDHDLYNLIMKIKQKKIIIPTVGKNSLFFKLRILIKIFEINFKHLSINLNVYENRNRFILSWVFDINTDVKLELFNLINKIKIGIAKNLDVFDEESKKITEKIYDLNFKNKILKNKEFGSLTAKFNVEIIDIFVSVFIKKINRMLNNENLIV